MSARSPNLPVRQANGSLGGQDRPRRARSVEDDVQRAKQALLELTEPRSSSPFTFLARHPLAAALAAFAGGVIVMRVPAARGLLKIAALWKIKDAFRALRDARG